MTFGVEAMGFHIGMVVHDAKAVVAAYQELLGGTFGIWDAPKTPPRSVDPDLEHSELRIAYGRYAGMTIEIIQVLSGRGHYAQWLAEHGEGVQHLGFWVPDLGKATERALEHGATLTSATINPEAVGSVTVAGLPPSMVGAAILPGSVHMSYGVSTVEIELLGPSSIDTLRGVLGDELTQIVDLPPWA